jgi:hypothetical protein
MAETQVDKYYKKEAKELIDLLFDRDFLNPELKRDSIEWLEDYIGFIFQSKSEMAAKTALLTAKLKAK